MKGRKVCLLHSGNLCWQHFMKEVIFPFYLEVKNQNLLGTKSKFILYSLRDIITPWKEVWFELFPQFQFDFMTYNLKNSPRFDMVIAHKWQMHNPKHKLYNKDIKPNHIQDFLKYLDSTIKKPKKMIEYDIILIKRNKEPRSSYYKDGQVDMLAGGVMNRYKYIANNDFFYKKLKKNFINYKVLYVDLIDLNFRERYWYFKNAKILIGQHGAAMIQSLFMKPKTHIIEFINHKFFDIGFCQQIAHLKPQYYHYCLYKGLIDQILTINVDALIKMIKNILSGTKYKTILLPMDTNLITKREPGPNGVNDKKFKFRVKKTNIDTILKKNSLKNIDQLVSQLNYNIKLIGKDATLTYLMNEITSINNKTKKKDKNIESNKELHKESNKESNPLKYDIRDEDILKLVLNVNN